MQGRVKSLSIVLLIVILKINKFQTLKTKSHENNSSLIFIERS